MSETYVIKKIMEPFTDDVWEQIPTLRAQNFPWDENGYKPETIAKICYSDKAIHVFLKSYEKKIRAVYESINDPVCRDSCMEFFFILNPESDDRYMNMEMNPIGTFLLGFGKDRHSRFKIEGLSPDIFNIKTSVKRPDQSIQRRILDIAIRDTLFLFGKILREDGDSIRK